MSQNALRDMSRIAHLPYDAQQAFRVLCEHVEDEEKLLALIAPKKRGRPKKRRAVTKVRKRGAPDLSPVSMSYLEEMVTAIRREGFASTDREAIKVFLETYAEFEETTVRLFAEQLDTRRGHKMTYQELVRSLQQRLSRYHSAQSRALQKP